MRLPPHWRRHAYLIALAAAIGVGLAVTYWSLTSVGMEDVSAYWSAAIRFREGQPLYPAALDTPNAMYYGEAYRYAPWFALAWVPLTYLPRELVTMAWAGTLLAAVAYVGWALRGRWIAFAVLMPFLLDSATEGNAQPLLVAGLVYGLSRRSGPLWIALAASLKGVPLAFVLVYLGRRQWRQAGITVGVTVLLVAPMLLFDVSHYPTDAGGRVLFYGSLMYPVAIAVAAAATLLLARSRWGWVAAGATAVLAMPRFWTYDLTWFAAAAVQPGVPPRGAPADAGSRAARAEPAAAGDQTNALGGIRDTRLK